MRSILLFVYYHQANSVSVNDVSERIFIAFSLKWWRAMVDCATLGNTVQMAHWRQASAR